MAQPFVPTHKRTIPALPRRATDPRGAAALLLLLLACLRLAGCAEPRQGKVIEEWETSNNTFKIRVTVYNEGNPQQPAQNGAYYKFESSPAGADKWSEVTTFWRPQRAPIPRDHVKFPNDKTGYFYWHDWFAVTTDGGGTWKMWDATKQIPDFNEYGPDFIRQEVTLDDGGNGTMILKRVTKEDPRQWTLRTRDYGQHWEQAQGL